MSETTATKDARIRARDHAAIVKRSREAAEELVEFSWIPRMMTTQIPGLALVIQLVAEWAYERGRRAGASTFVADEGELESGDVQEARAPEHSTQQTGEA